ncbi:anacyclamide/piricyclamide family prenylated cyclic peptide [Streptosporangium sp. NPDC051022]
MSTSHTMPHQSAPVERTLTGTTASDTAGITPSLHFPGTVFPFAGDDDN